MRAAELMPPRPIVSSSRRSGSDALAVMVCGVVVMMQPITSLGVSGTISLGAIAALLMFPVFVGELASVRYARLIFVLWLLAVLSGPVLLQWTGHEPGRGVDLAQMRRTITFTVAAALTFVALVWGRRLKGSHWVGFLIAVGATAQALLDPMAWQSNPWKLAFAWPTAVMLLVLVRQKKWQILILLGLAVFSVLADFRSFAGLCLLTAGLVIWGLFGTRRHGLRVLLVTAVTAIMLLQLGTYLAERGDLGSAIQARTLEQTGDGTRSLLLGARPEAMAALALARETPLGYGPGLMPSTHDQFVASQAMQREGVAPDSDYVNSYLLGGRLELHSILSDFWVNFGLLGLALILALIYGVARGLGRSLSGRSPDAFIIFVLVLAVWDAAFSPMSNLLHLILAAVVALPVRSLNGEHPKSGPAVRYRRMTPATHQVDGPDRPNPQFA